MAHAPKSELDRLEWFAAYGASKQTPRVAFGGVALLWPAVVAVIVCLLANAVWQAV